MLTCTDLGPPFIPSWHRFSICWTAFAFELDRILVLRDRSSAVREETARAATGLYIYLGFCIERCIVTSS